MKKKDNKQAYQREMMRKYRADLPNWYILILLKSKGFRAEQVTKEDIKAYRLRIIEFRERKAKKEYNR